MRPWIVAPLCWLSVFAQTHVQAQAVEPAVDAKPVQLVVQLDPSIADAIRAEIRAALATELSVELLDRPTPGVQTLTIRRTPDGHVELTLQDNPAPITRTLPWTGDAGGQSAHAAIRDVALMAKNLVQDQTRELLANAPGAGKPDVTPASAAPIAVPTTVTAERPSRAPLDAEHPPDFAPKPAPPPAVPTPENRARMQVLAVIAPTLAADSSLEDRRAVSSIPSLGVQARFDLPIASRLSAGGGVGVYGWDRTAELREDEIPIEPTAVMDATLWLRAHAPIAATRAELYALVGAGPSLQNGLSVSDTSSREEVAPSYLGLNAALLAGASLLLTRQLGLALELGAHYHLMHGRLRSGDHLIAHTLHIAAQLGVVWIFDAR